jgi:hypothetical protein
VNSVGEEEIQMVTKRQVDSKDKEMKKRKEKRRYYNSAFALIRNFAD